MFIEALLLGVAVGLFRGGSVKNLRTAHIRMPVLLVLAFLVQVLVSFMLLAGSSFFINQRLIFYAISYGLLFVALFANLNNKAVWLVVLGSLLNFAVIFLNGGTLPIAIEALEKAGFNNRLELIQAGRLVQYELIEGSGNWLGFLGKRLTPPAMYPIKQVFSLGDVLISVGVFLWIQNLLLGGGQYQKARVIRIDHRGKIWR